MRLLLIVLVSGCVADPCDRVGGSCVVAGLPGQAALGEEGVPAVESALYFPQDVVFRGDRWWVDDDNNHRVREISPDGVIETVAGVAFPGDGPEGDATAARINHPSTLTWHPTDPDILLVTAIGNHRVSELNVATRQWTWFLGTGFAGETGDGGPPGSAMLNRPSATAVGPDGTLYVSDRLNQVIRRVSPDGMVSTFAGTLDRRGYAGDGGPAAEATLHAPEGYDFEPSNRLVVAGDQLVVADTGNHVVRRIDLTTGVIPTIAGRATPGFDADGDLAVETRLFSPYAVDVSADGRVMITDTGNHCVRELLPDGRLETRMGVCGELGGADEGDADGPVHLNWPGCARFAPDGSLYVCDTRNHVVRRTPLPNL
jgi:serine/threonine-protein kinase